MGIDGSITIPGGTDIWPHELETAKALADAGHVVEFLPRIEGDRAKSADVVVDGLVWEIKSPTSGKLDALKKNLRRGAKQSHNIIIDVARMRGVSDQAAEQELRRLAPLVKSVTRIRMVTKRRTLVDIP